MGGRLVLIRHVLQSMAIHIMAAFEPPKAIMQRIESLFANFFWGQIDGIQKYHWIRWSKCCLHVTEGGLGVRSLEDTCKAFSMRLWWNLRQANSIWAKFMKSKYVGNDHISNCTKPSICSHTWMRTVRLRSIADSNIGWHLGKGISAFGITGGLEADYVI
ncbi:hypothetical protein LguiB_005943 [Lonicera macranthoides]